MRFEYNSDFFLRLPFTEPLSDPELTERLEYSFAKARKWMAENGFTPPNAERIA
jgi:hypothetical protein